MIQRKYDKVVINIYETREEMGEAAAREASQYIKKLLEEKEEINVCLRQLRHRMNF